MLTLIVNYSAFYGLLQFMDFRKVPFEIALLVSLQSARQSAREVCAALYRSPSRLYICICDISSQYACLCV